MTSVASSWRSVDALVRSGHLIKETGGRGKHDCNTYKFEPAMFADVAIEGETKTPEAVVSSVDHIPPPHPLTSSEAASELAARFAELLNQPQKYSAEKRKEWPQVFDKLLGNHSQADLLAVIGWIFKVEFWVPKVRVDRKGAMAYFVEKLDTMMAAIAHPAPTSSNRRNSQSRNPSERATFDVNQLLTTSII